MESGTVRDSAGQRAPEVSDEPAEVVCSLVPEHRGVVDHHHAGPGRGGAELGDVVPLYEAEGKGKRLSEVVVALKDGCCHPGGVAALDGRSCGVPTACAHQEGALLRWRYSEDQSTVEVDCALQRESDSCANQHSVLILMACIFSQTY